jgi:hypothetical protein
MGFWELQMTRVETTENWLLEENWAGWDRQIEEDAAAGRLEKLDRLFETALADHQAGKSQEL